MFSYIAFAIIECEVWCFTDLEVRGLFYIIKAGWDVGRVFRHSIIVTVSSKESLEFLLNDILCGSGFIILFYYYEFFRGVHLIHIDFLNDCFRVGVG